MYKNWLLSGQKAFFDVYLVLVFGRIVIFLCDDLMKTIKKGLSIVLYERYAKRVIDLVLGIVILVVLSPVFLILMILIKLDSRGPVFFRQKRVGRDKEYFSILKFRTMRTDAPKDMPTHLLQNPDAFITRVGKFLRKTSLDELPQLLNIIKGDMSFIGPRPALWNQFDLIEERDRYHANEIRPGMSGWAQINGRDELEISVKARLDGEYRRRMSLLFDIRCFVGTFFSVLRQDGVVESAHPMEEQKG